MSESIYFSLLFKSLSNSNGEIISDVLQSLSKCYPDIDSDKLMNMYRNWQINPQIWSFKSDKIASQGGGMSINNKTVPFIKNDDSVTCRIKSNAMESTTMKSNITSDDVNDLQNIVIHVCDEPKKLKKDFFCTKKLLIKEMRYFSDYLSSENQSFEDVDISVHCDVNIFDWLMKYVKRDQIPERDQVSVSSLKPNNVVSILISSDFLKMDSLVDECLEYIHCNLNELLSTSCNINCVNSGLIEKIADKFTDLEIDGIIDKKDKIKSKLFRNKIEQLFDPISSKKLFTVTCATNLYKCKFCNKILIPKLDFKIICLESRLGIDTYGDMIYFHESDDKWSIETQMTEWVTQYRSSSNTLADSTAMIYWRLWAHLNVVRCERCSNIFPLYEIGHCRYHSDAARFGKDDSKGVIPIVEGMFTCCGVKTLRFDPFKLNRGCKWKDHIVNLCTHHSMKYVDEEVHLRKILDVLQKRRTWFEVMFVRGDGESDYITNVFTRDTLISRGRLSDLILKDDNENKTNDVDLSDVSMRPKLQPLIKHYSSIERIKKVKSLNKSNMSGFDDIDEDNVESEDIDQDTFDGGFYDNQDSLVTIKTGAILLDAPQFPVINNKKWDSNKSMRYNQDSQRQEDLRRMRQIVNYLTDIRRPNEKTQKLKPREFIGGMYCYLEQQWKNELLDRTSSNILSLYNQKTSTNVKAKARPSIGTQPFR